MKRNRVLLMLPPAVLPSYGQVFITEPLGLAYVASALERDGYEVRILDCILAKPDCRRLNDGRRYFGLDRQSIREAVTEYKPDFVGISSMFTAWHEIVAELFEIIKREISSDIVTICGGAHPTVAGEEVLDEGNVDYIVLGEGDEATPRLLNALNGDGRVEGIDGVGYKTDGRAVVERKSRFITDLDTLGFPARHLLDMERYFLTSRRHSREKVHTNSASLLSSRSCPARCVFCSAQRLMGPYRMRSVESVLEEIEFLLERYAVKRVIFFDDNFNYDKARTVRLLREMAARKYPITWFSTNLTLYKLDCELLELMKASGCEEIDVSIESSSQNTLKLMNKPLDIKIVKPLISKMKELGLKVTASFVIGIPGETREDIRNTVEYARALDLDYCAFSIATPHLGTRLHEICCANGYFVEGFRRRDLQFGTGVIRTDKFDPAYLEYMRKWGWEQANFIDKGLPVPVEN